MRPEIETAIEKLMADLAHEYTSPASEFVERILTTYGEGKLTLKQIEIATTNFDAAMEGMEHNVRMAARSNPEMLHEALAEAGAA